MVEQLEENKIIWLNGEVLKKRRPHIFHYYYENLSTILDVKNYCVVDFLINKKIGAIDQEFVAKNGETD